jgi:16S rRNA (uracil1498-N3)-methyltransferase
MRNHHHFLFFADRIEGGLLSLDADETRHAVSVLRLKPGDPLLATDGAGKIAECIYDSAPHGCLAGKITSRAVHPRHPCSIHMFIGLPERDAFESLLCDLTALGVERITPLVCRYCQRPWWEKKNESLGSRFRGKMVAALKQSCYPWLPVLDPPLPFATLDAAATSGFLIAADAEGVPFSMATETIPTMPNVYTGIIGPPGGFAPEETAALRNLGMLFVKLAASRLTTELASVVLASEIIGARMRDEGGRIKKSEKRRTDVF